ncbi:hypothetical protein OTERR_13030 [Oryzomicrobium terrae]|uniref:Uncharacterized protein n=1 Tax=Oryzomicrobium terrae TaxID=1735038 RepID=A0A5C1E847_9RHOO|nr:hypothetical protein [Oryzomicrobium terrae]QEL64779.1 hypothetical protein OTERR_13030 [Oryzomicrobium terrae]
MIDPIKLGPFKGINNRLPATQLVGEEGAFLADAVNVDITAAGTLKRRAGFGLITPLPGAHSLWGDEQAAFVADADTLHRIDPLTLALTPLFTGLASARLSYARINDDVVWTDGDRVRRVTAAGQDRANWLDAPSTAPVPLRVPGGGSIPAGQYRFMVAWAEADGAESPGTYPVALDVQAGDAIQLTGLSTVAPPEAAVLNIFMTEPNGAQFYLAASLLVSVLMPVFELRDLPALSRAPTSWQRATLPGGQIIRGYNGRVLVARGAMLYYTEPYHRGLLDPTKGYIPFDADITLMEPCQNGVYVAAGDTTWWLQGADIAQAEMMPVLPYGAVLGTGCTMPNSNDVWWYSPRGMVIGSQDGLAKNVQEANVITGGAGYGASVVREQGGMRTLITSVFDSAAAVGGDPVTTWAFALETGATARYDKFRLNSFANILGKCYGATGDGVHLLEGDTDAGAAIEAVVDFGSSDFGTSRLKSLATAYLGVQATGDVALRITVNGADQYTYKTRRTDAFTRSQRVDTGRGLRANYLKFELINPGGADFELDRLELTAIPLSRRI